MWPLQTRRVDTAELTRLFDDEVPLIDRHGATFLLAVHRGRSVYRRTDIGTSRSVDCSTLQPAALAACCCADVPRLWLSVPSTPRLEP